MRLRLINYLKQHPVFLNFFWHLARLAIQFVGLFIPIQSKTMLFASLGGRKFDDSPKAIYNEICARPDFDDWRLIWAFVEPDSFILSRGEKVKIDTPSFFWVLLRSRVWVSNSGMDRGIELRRKGTLKVETWHGVPLKKIGGEEHSGSMLIKQRGDSHCPLDTETLRCAQSSYDLAIFQRVFHASADSFLLCDLPRNDTLLRYTTSDCAGIRQSLEIPDGKKIILYTPTYREYLMDAHNENYIAPPLDLKKWERLLGAQYVLLFRAHYVVTAALNLKETDFVRNVSEYPVLNDLYAISDLMISDYSGTFVDYSILDRPMLCFAYDLEEYEKKRGLYLNLKTALPCPIDKNEDTLLDRIQTLSFDEYSSKTKCFHKTYAPHAGHASKAVVDEMVRRLHL